MSLSLADVDVRRLPARDHAVLELATEVGEKGVAAVAEERGLTRAEVQRQCERLGQSMRALAGDLSIPPLNENEYEALKASIAERGQWQPILQDGSTGETIDGAHRLRACGELGIEPWISRVDANADQRAALALALNMARRQMGAGAKRGAAEAALIRDPSKSDRQIARLAGISPTTVGVIRKELEGFGAVSKLDTRVDATGREQAATKPARSTAARAKRAGDVAPSAKKGTLTISTQLRAEDGWVSCSAVRLVDAGDGTYRLEVKP